MKRFHVDGEPENSCAEKAFSHLKRGLLDAFKLKLKYHNKDYLKLMRMKFDMRIIDNGEFLPLLLKKRKDIIKLAKEARLQEGKKDIDEAFDRWYKASELIDQFESDFFESPKLQWAKKLGIFHRIWKFIVGIIIGVIGSVIVRLLFP